MIFTIFLVFLFPLNMSELRKEFVGRQFYAKVSVWLNWLKFFRQF